MLSLLLGKAVKVHISFSGYDLFYNIPHKCEVSTNFAQTLLSHTPLSLLDQVLFQENKLNKRIKIYLSYRLLSGTPLRTNAQDHIDTVPFKDKRRYCFPTWQINHEKSNT